MLETLIIDRTLDEFGFGMSREIQQLQHFERNDKLRMIIKATTEDGNSVVIKYFDDTDVRPHAIEVQGHLSECYLQSGVSVPRRYINTDGRYYSSQTLNGRNVCVTVEDFLPGKELELVSLAVVKNLGELLGKMHSTTEASKISLGNGSAWTLFTGNEVDIVGQFDENLDNANRFFTELRKHPVDVDLLVEIERAFYLKRSRLEKVWPYLPKGAVQGDFSPNNILLDANGNIAGIIDFHLAGDEIYVNHMMSEGVFLAYTCEQIQEETPSMRDEYLYAFVEGYQRYRPLSDNEKSTLNLLYNIFKPFRFQELNEAKQKASQGIFIEVNEHLQYMSYHISRIMF